MHGLKPFLTPHARRYIAGALGAIALSYIDWFVPQTVKDAGLEAVRRSRLLVAASFVLILFAFPFLALMYRFEGYMSPTAWAFVSGVLFLLCTPFLLRWIGSHGPPGILFSFVIIIHFAALAYLNGGYDSAVLVWHPVVPLLATLLVGPRFGLTCAVFVALETLVLYFLNQAGYPFPRPLTAEQIRVFHVAGSATVIAFVGVVAWLYEQLRKSAMDLAGKALVTLRHSERYFRLLIENTSDLITIVDSRGVIQYCNPAYERRLGYSPTELFGKNAFDLIHPDDCCKIRQAFNNPQLDDAALLECRVLHKDGSWRIFEAGAKNLLHDPAVHGVIVTSRDITEQKQIERLKDELVSTVSHELRTPLTSMRGFTELMLKKDFPRDKQREFLTIIQNESIRLTNLINDFLDLQRLESGSQTYDFSPIHLEVLMHEVAALIVPNNGVHLLRTTFPSQLPQVRADPDRLRQVLTNLISNAVKYSPNGGRITLGARQQNGTVVAWVADEGMGIPAEAIPRLFTKFFRVDNQDTRSIGGTGLGLSLVKRIIEAHDGRVWVESTEGVGSTFFFTLPLAEVEQRETVLL